MILFTRSLHSFQSPTEHDAIHLVQITVTALSPLYALKPDEAKAEWDRVIRDLRQAGARPRDVSARAPVLCRIHLG